MSLIEISEPQPLVRQLMFNRPEKLNALSSPMLQELDAALVAAAEDDTVRVLILRGAGGRAFVAGADIAEYRGDQRAAFIAYQHEGRRLFDAIESFPKPVIAAVEGYAFGGGFEIALCCDLIVCADTAQFALPEGKLGLCPGGGGSQRLTRAVGKFVASEVMLAGWRIDARRAVSLGLAVDAVPAESLDDSVLSRARGCLKVSPLAQSEMKRLVREGIDASLSSAKSLEQEVLFRLYSSQDGQEGIAAFLDKREPEFQGT